MERLDSDLPRGIHEGLGGHVERHASPRRKEDPLRILAVTNVYDLVEARRAGQILALSLGFGSFQAGKVALAISELARNMLQYAREGEVRLRPLFEGQWIGLLIAAGDRGGGIRELDSALHYGFSTSGGLGMGLSGVLTLADEFEILSDPGQGTQVEVIIWRE